MALRLTDAEKTERHDLTNQVLYATSLDEIRAARTALVEWLGRHPADRGAEAGFEQLDMMEESWGVKREYRVLASGGRNPA